MIVLKIIFAFMLIQIKLTTSVFYSECLNLLHKYNIIENVDGSESDNYAKIINNFKNDKDQINNRIINKIISIYKKKISTIDLTKDIDAIKSNFQHYFLTELNTINMELNNINYYCKLYLNSYDSRSEITLNIHLELDSSGLFNYLLTEIDTVYNTNIKLITINYNHYFNNYNINYNGNKFNIEVIKIKIKLATETPAFLNIPNYIFFELLFYYTYFCDANDGTNVNFGGKLQNHNNRSAKLYKLINDYNIINNGIMKFTDLFGNIDRNYLVNNLNILLINILNNEEYFKDISNKTLLTRDEFLNKFKFLIKKFLDIELEIKTTVQHYATKRRVIDPAGRLQFNIDYKDNYNNIVSGGRYNIPNAKSNK